MTFVLTKALTTLSSKRRRTAVTITRLALATAAALFFAVSFALAQEARNDHHDNQRRTPTGLVREVREATERFKARRNEAMSQAVNGRFPIPERSH
jgi:hypothetical protein